jgi:tetratricopeptide (TPR) repeat protein
VFILCISSQRQLPHHLIKLLREHYGRDNNFEVARALVNVGSIMVKAGQAQDAFAIFKKAITSFNREISPVHFEMMILLRFIGDACVKEKEFSNGLGSYQEAFDVLKKAGSLADSVPLEVARLHLGLSLCALGLGKLDDALAACQQAAALCSVSQRGQLKGEIGFDIIWQRAKILNEQHQGVVASEILESIVSAHDEALSTLKVACSNNEQAAAERAAYVFQSRGLLLYRSAHHERAIIDHLEALRLHRIACKGTQTPVTVVFNSNLAQCHLALGRYQEALDSWTNIESCLAVLFPNEKDQCAPLMSCTINRAVVLLAMGRKEEAISAVLAAKKLGSTFGVASAVFAVQCVMTSASCSSYLSACVILYLLPELDSSSGNAISNSVVQSFSSSVMKLVKDASPDPNDIFRMSSAAIPSVWCDQFVDNLSDRSRSVFESAIQHLKVHLFGN